jgi:hypothetical protein
MLNGVDSARKVDAAFVHTVVETLGLTPAFWGRYLGTGGGAAEPLAAAEVSLLHERGVSLLLIWNDATPSDLHATADAVAQARAAILRCRQLQVPAGVTVYVDIEAGWPLDPGWLVAWQETLAAADYSAGAYLTVARPPVARALASLPSSTLDHLHLWNAGWISPPGTYPYLLRTAEGERIAPPAWPAWLPAAVGAWQYAGDVAGMVDLDLIDEALPSAPVLWAPPPDPGSVARRIATLARDIVTLADHLPAAT